MFLCCGDALFDLFVNPESETREQGTAVQLAGDVGGSPLNVAVGLARLQHRSAFYTGLSSDIFGSRIRRYLKANSVDISACVDSACNTTLAIIEKQPDGSADYAFHLGDTADVQLPSDQLPGLVDSIKVLHFGSYSTAIEPVASTLVALAEREQAARFISYDPNLRLSIEPDVTKWQRAFDRFATTANVIKASDEDIEALFGKHGEAAFRHRCFELGAELVFVTRGGDGASVYNGTGTEIHGVAEKVEVVDTVGAGDTFQAAILHWLADRNALQHCGLLSQTDLATCLTFALHAAAVTCTRSGANLPTLQQLTV